MIRVIYSTATELSVL